MNPQVGAVESWLNSVSYSHSQSRATEQQYKRVWGRFSNSIGKTAEKILEEYKASNDRSFKHEYSQLIRTWIFQLIQEGLSVTSIKVMVGAVKSFFKYNDLPLGMIPQAMSGIIYHNRDITKDEIIQIMAVSKIREKAFFTVMAQSGLRPHTIKQLKLKNLENFDRVPCKIDIPREITKGKYGSYVTFLGSDAIKYLKQYLATRADLTPNSLLFCSHRDPMSPVDVKDVSRAFRMAARKLEKSGALHYEIREGKPSELRFYTLRKFFRKYANQMGFEHVNYVMGHTTKGSDSNYTPRDSEFYRELYEEKAMPFLRLETATPTETEKTIVELKKHLAERDKEVQAMKEAMTKIQPLVEFVNSLDTPEQLKTLLNFFRDDLIDQYEDEKLRPIKVEFSPYISNRIKEIAKTMGITEQEALKQLVEDDLELMEKAEQKFKRLSERPKQKSP